MIKSFRNKLEAGDQDTIRLSTNQGLVGYRIVKLQLISDDPGGIDVEGVVKVFQHKQTSITNTIDFTDPTLLAAAFYENDNHNSYYGGETIIFDQTKINQDIYVTYQGYAGTTMNYYIELEKVKLDTHEATVATLKDMRGRE